nr:efflux RND transporter permease subunit [Burkholderiaceae bacterium]
MADPTPPAGPDGNDAPASSYEAARRRPISALNLSAWALTHRPLVIYLMVVLLIGGVAAFFALGQDEDPPFTFRAMVVRAFWPGATAQQMAEQVTDKLERKLQETPYVDKIRS